MAVCKYSIAFLLVLLYLAGFQGDVLCADGTDSFFLHSSSKEAGAGLRNWLIADFDGDHISDLAIGRSGAFGVRVQIRLSTEGSETSIHHHSTEPGLRVLAYDVDRDNDQDLIFVSSTSLSPPAVWLNNGKGHFEQSEPLGELNLTDEGYCRREIDPFQAEAAPITQDDDRSSLDRSSILRGKPTLRFTSPSSASQDNLATEPRALLLSPHSPPPNRLLFS